MASGRRTLTGSPALPLGEVAGRFGLGRGPQRELLREAARRFPLRWTRYYLDLADPGDPADPIRRIALPAPAELGPSAVEIADPVGERRVTPVPFVVRKHRDRAVFLVTSHCHVYCRFCFRREGGYRDPSEEELDRALAYLTADPDLREVILSGGDPLVLPDETLRDLVARLSDAPRLESLRIHTRAPVHDPARVTPGLAAALASGLPARVVLHYDHPREITKETRRVVSTFLEAGLPMLNQSVLLAGVNDDADTLEELCRGLHRERIRPYYLHHPDPAPGAGAFFLEPERGLALYRELERRLGGGPALPSYVIDPPDGSGKVPVDRYLGAREGGPRPRPGRLVCSLLPTGGAMSHHLSESLDRYIEDSRAGFEKDLKRLVEIPSVSMDPAHAEDVERGAREAAALLKSYGATARVVPTKGHPVVIGEMVTGKDHPWVTVYNHLDVQPADEPTWVRPPFEMAVENGEYFARGATDDKGPGLTALYAARYAVEKGIPLNIRFLWENEEEIGSPSFEAMVKAERRSLKSDSVLVSDTIWIAKGRPAVPYGLRGLQAVSIRLETGAKDTHSGLTGGAARNPVAEMGWLVSKMMDPRTGRVKIPGFYDDVQKLTAKQRKDFAGAGFRVSTYKKAHELKKLRSDDPMAVMKSIWAMPTFEIHGINGGYQGPGIKTVVPSWAELKISCRLVPKMKPAKVVKQIRAFVREHLPGAKVKEEHRLDWFLGESGGPYAEAASDALKFGFGRRPAFIREGGSIGSVLTMQQQLECPVVLVGLSLPEHGYHCPNEKYDWGQASGGMKTFVKYFDLISGIGR